MHDRSDSRDDRGGPRDGREHHDRSDGGDRDAPRGDGGGGGDSRFLQLEISQLMYAEAEAAVRPAVRELLLEAAKERLRERFGDRITQLARLAVDEELRGMQASLDVEARIREHQEQRRQPPEQLRDLFAARPAGAEPAQQRAAKRQAGAPRRGRRKR